MRDIIEDVYDTTIDFLDRTVRAVVRGFLFITSPLWVIPYKIFRDRKGGFREWVQ